MNSVLFGSGSPFIIFHFAQRASQPSAAACHVKTLYQALTAPPLHTQCAWLMHTSLAFTPPTPTHTPTYVGNICSDLCVSTTPHTLLSHPLQYSHLSSFVKSVFPFFCPSPNLVETSHMSAVMLLLEKLTGTVLMQWISSEQSVCLCVHACMCACVSTRHLKQVLSYLGCGQSVCWPLSCFGEHVDIKRF